MNLPTFLIADGSLLSVPSAAGQTAALTVAEDRHWAMALEKARQAISIGSKRIEAGETYEQALANVGAFFLRAGRLGSIDPACGRTSNEAEWEVQQERWNDLVFAVAALGSAHSERVYGTNPPEFVLTGTVWTANGRVPLTDVPRSER